MVEIKAKKTVSKYGITSIVYKNGRKRESAIEFAANGEYRCLCCFSKDGSCLSFSYADLETAKEKTEKYLSNIHQFAGGAKVTYI